MKQTKGEGNQSPNVNTICYSKPKNKIRRGYKYVQETKQKKGTCRRQANGRTEIRTRAN
jgi:hypothetical protein